MPVGKTVALDSDPGRKGPIFAYCKDYPSRGGISCSLPGEGGARPVQQVCLRQGSASFHTSHIRRRKEHPEASLFRLNRGLLDPSWWSVLLRIKEGEKVTFHMISFEFCIMNIIQKMKLF